MPPLWNSYVTVDSADAAADRAQKLGATVHAPPFDVMDVGRMAVIQDPQGAFFMVWEPKHHIGASVVNAAGALSWNELATPDIDASAKFYGELFGWKVRDLRGHADALHGDSDRRREQQRRSARRHGERADLLARLLRHRQHRERLASATELGATTLVGPIDIGAGQIGVLQDPQGAVFALYAGQFDE